tara:strand:+ start:645 stop:896 length:252 start_codon:yes stop_codon:yes gene_type:complete
MEEYKMMKKIMIGIDRWMIIEHIGADTWQIVESHRCRIQGKQGDMVKDTNVGWVVFRDATCKIPKYRVPSHVLVEDYNLGEEE